MSYEQRSTAAMVFAPPRSKMLGLITELTRRVSRWEDPINRIGSDYLREKADWVKMWLQNEGQSKVDRLVSEASLRSVALLNTLERKVDSLLNICTVLESAEEEVIEKYDSLLDWVLEIPAILQDMVGGEAPIRWAPLSPIVYTQSGSDRRIHTNRKIAA